MADQELSAGLIPYRDREGTRRLLLLQYPQGHWGFPKGHVEPRETLWETACRELREETGLKDPERFPDFSYHVQYQYRRDDRTIFKTVVFFAGAVGGDAVTLSHEHRDYLWTPPASARQQLTYDDERVLLEEWVRRLES